MPSRLETQRMHLIYFDVANFSTELTPEQQRIVTSLSSIVDGELKRQELLDEKLTITIPTGDGVLIALIKQNIKIVKEIAISLHNQMAGYDIVTRMGIDTGQCLLYEDINGRSNILGGTITTAEKIMDGAEDNQLDISEEVFQELKKDDDCENFTEKTKEINGVSVSRYTLNVTQDPTTFSTNPTFIIDDIKERDISTIFFKLGKFFDDLSVESKLKKINRLGKIIFNIIQNNGFDKDSLFLPINGSIGLGLIDKDPLEFIDIASEILEECKNARLHIKAGAHIGTNFIYPYRGYKNIFGHDINWTARVVSKAKDDNNLYMSRKLGCALKEREEIKSYILSIGLQLVKHDQEEEMFFLDINYRKKLAQKEHSLEENSNSDTDDKSDANNNIHTDTTTVAGTHQDYNDNSNSGTKKISANDDFSPTISQVDYENLRKKLFNKEGESADGGIIPLIGNGFSARSGIADSRDFSDYLNYVFFRCLIDENSHNIKKLDWPIFPPKSDIEIANESIKYCQYLIHGGGNEKFQEKIQINKDQLKKSSKIEIVKIGLGYLGNWKTALGFLSRLNYIEKNGHTRFDIQNLPNSHRVKSFIRQIFRDCQPNLGHKVLANLSRLLPIKTIFSVNTDSLLEAAFEQIQENLNVVDVGFYSGFPDSSILQLNRNLVKIYGGLQEISTNLLEYTTPSLSDMLNFTSFFTKNDTSYPTLSNTESRKSGACLLIIGVSANDEYVNRLIEFALTSISNFSVYWIYDCDETFDAIEKRFSNCTSKNQIITHKAGRPDIFLYEMYQDKSLSLPPGNLNFRYSLNVPPTLPIQDKEDREFKDACENIVNELQSNEDYNKKPKPLNIQTKTHDIRISLWDDSYKKVINNVTLNHGNITTIQGTSGVSRLAAMCYEKLVEDTNIHCIWLELDDIGSVNMLKSETIRAMANKLGRPYHELCTLDLELGNDESQHIYLQEGFFNKFGIIQNDWIFFMYGRCCPGTNYGWVQKIWNTEGKYKPYNELWTFFCILANSGFKIVYMPFTEDRKQRLQEAVESRIDFGESDAVVERPIKPEIEDDNFIRNISVIHSDVKERVEKWLFEENKNVKSYFNNISNQKVTWYKIRFLYTLTNFRHFCNSAALTSEAAFPCPCPFNIFDYDNDNNRNDCVRIWVRELEKNKIIRRKAGSFIWFHRDNREVIRIYLENPGNKDNKLNAVYDCERGIKGIKARTHLWIADWYLKAFRSSNDPFTLIESLHHRYKTLMNIEDAELSAHNRIRIVSESVIYSLFIDYKNEEFSKEDWERIDKNATTSKIFKNVLENKTALIELTNVRLKERELTQEDFTKYFDDMHNFQLKKLIPKRPIEELRPVLSKIENEAEINVPENQLLKEYSDAHFNICEKRFKYRLYEITFIQILNTIRMAQDSLVYWIDIAYARSFFSNTPFQNESFDKTSWFETLKKIDENNKLGPIFGRIKTELESINLMIEQEIGESRITRFHLNNNYEDRKKFVEDFENRSQKSEEYLHLKGKDIKNLKPIERAVIHAHDDAELKIFKLRLQERDYEYSWAYLDNYGKIFNIPSLFRSISEESVPECLPPYIDQLILEQEDTKISNFVLIPILFSVAQLHVSICKLGNDRARYNQTDRINQLIKTRWSIASAILNHLLRFPILVDNENKDQVVINNVHISCLYGVCLGHLNRFGEAHRRIDEGASFLARSNLSSNSLQKGIINLRRAELLIQQSSSISDERNASEAQIVHLRNAWDYLDLSDKHLSNFTRSVWWRELIYVLQLRVAEAFKRIVDQKEIKEHPRHVLIPIAKRCEIIERGLLIGTTDVLRKARLMDFFVSSLNEEEKKYSQERIKDYCKIMDKMKMRANSSLVKGANLDLDEYVNKVQEKLKSILHIG